MSAGNANEPSAHRPFALPRAPALAIALLAAACGSACGSASDPRGGGVESAPSSSRTQTCCPIAELRQYTLRPGQRDVLIELFDREFIETQEATGMTVIGQFRDLGAPDRFVWLRGFHDMPSRAGALTSFYGGPVWKAHGKAAGATMIDSNDVRLLRPASSAAGFALAERSRPPRGAQGVPERIVTSTVYSFSADVSDDFVALFERELTPVLTEAGAQIAGYFVTENSPNTYPALPVREGEHVFVWLAHFADRAAYDRHVAALAASARWREIAPALERRFSAPPQVLLLSPTSRSLL